MKKVILFQTFKNSLLTYFLFSQNKKSNSQLNKIQIQPFIFQKSYWSLQYAKSQIHIATRSSHLYCKKMLESSPAFLKCHQCKKGPKEFSFLLCNHVICGKCISKNIQITDKYNLVKCSCGCLTYFNEDNQIVEMQDLSEIRAKRLDSRTKTQQNHLYETKQKKAVKKRKTVNSQDLKEIGYQTLNNQRSTIPNISMSQIFSLQNNIQQDDSNSHRRQLPQSTKMVFKSSTPSLKRLSNKLIGTQNTGCEESQLLEKYQSVDINGKQPKSKHINQFSTHYIIEGTRQSFPGDEKSLIIPNVKNLKSSVMLPDNSISRQKSPHTLKQKQSQVSHKSRKEEIHSRFQNEIDFVSMLFKKDFQQVQYQFSKCLNEIKNMYSTFQNSLRSLYCEQVITNKSAFALNLSDIIKERYEKQIAQKFKLLKNNLLGFFHTFRHNQNLNSPKTSSNIHLTQFVQRKKKHNQFSSNQTLNHSQIIDDIENDCQSQTIKNKKVQRFQTVEEKLERLTTKNHQIRNKQSKNQLNLTNFSSNKRVQTQNIHANINSHQNNNFLEKQNLHRGNYSFDEFTPETNCRLSQKTHKRSNPVSFEKEIENKRRQVLYFSPSMPYCYKHLKEKKSEAKNYLSFIEQLCHEKKMKNNQELFKKVRQGSQLYEFKNRE